MSIKAMFKSAVAGIAFAAIGTTAAYAQGCEETEFTSANAEFYLKAETELIVNKNPQAALAALNELNSRDLNCYEYGNALQLGAGIKIENKDYAGAARDLISAIDQGYIKGEAVPKMYFQLSQIYLTAEDLGSALTYFDKWIAAGGQPNRDTKWQLAVINQREGRIQQSLRWAEEVFATDGPNASRDVYNFLIYLYDETGQLGKKARLLEQLLVKNPNERRLWDAIAGDYFRADEERKAFEVQKAMYLGGILQTEDELVRIVNFYNQFDAPYPAARILEKEINAGRISKNYKNLELLSQLYQVAREYERAIPVVEEAAQMSSNGEMYVRLGRSYLELQDWAKAEDALLKAINKGGLRDTGLAWVQIGQARYERKDRAGAREAFRTANNRGGRGWLAFMQSEDNTEKALIRFEAASLVQDLKTEEKRCEDLAVLGGEPTAACQSVEERLADAEEKLAAIGG